MSSLTFLLDLKVSLGFQKERQKVKYQIGSLLLSALEHLMTALHLQIAFPIKTKDFPNVTPCKHLQ